MSETEKKPKISDTESKEQKSKSKYKYLKVCLLPEDLKAVHAAAKTKQVSASEYVRQRLDLKIDDKRDTNKDILKKQLLYHLRRIGVNLNQVAKRINTSKQIDNYVAEQITEIKDELKHLRGEL